MLLAQQGGMPLGHLFAGFLTHFMSPAWVLRLMLGTMLVVMTVFLFIREPAIDNMRRRHLAKRTLWGNIFEAFTAYSHHPDYPSEIAVTSLAGNGDTYDGHNQQRTPLDP